MLIPLAINNNICLLAIGTLIVLAVTVLHCIALSDIADSHHPDLFRLTETWIKPTTTPAELVDCTMPGYTLISHPCTLRSQKSLNVGGGTAFLVRETFSQIPSPISAYTSFEASAITLKLRSSKLTVFNVYRPPVSSNYAKPRAAEPYVPVMPWHY